YHCLSNFFLQSGGLGPLNYPLLSDFNKTISRDYGVLVEEEGVALRGLFIIDPKGILRQITVNDLPVGRSVDETLRLVKAFQFVEEHGEGATWVKKQQLQSRKQRLVAEGFGVLTTLHPLLKMLALSVNDSSRSVGVFLAGVPLSPKS
ncbi:unnamed protein product, partial [Timema podura]|nr:unnamed protein product [Timema podura]